MSVYKWKLKTKEGKKLKKKEQLEEQEAPDCEDPDCEPPAPKKKKKKDKLAAAQTNGHIQEDTDMNGNVNGVETPKQKIKKNKGDAEVSGVYLMCLT